MFKGIFSYYMNLSEKPDEKFLDNNKKFRLQVFSLGKKRRMYIGEFSKIYHVERYSQKVGGYEGEGGNFLRR